MFWFLLFWIIPAVLNTLLIIGKVIALKSFDTEDLKLMILSIFPIINVCLLFGLIANLPDLTIFKW